MQNNNNKFNDDNNNDDNNINNYYNYNDNNINNNNPEFLLKQSILKDKFPHFWTWMTNLRAFQPVLGRKFHVESEFDVKNSQIQSPEGKN